MLRWLNKWLAAASSEDAETLFRRGAEANRAGRHPEAAQLLVRAIRASPGVAEFHYELGCAMRRLHEPGRAVTCFREALKCDPGHVDAHVDLAVTMLGLGQAQAAERSALEALRLAPRSLPALVNLGAALEAQGRFAEAADRYRSALEVDPGCVAARVNLGGVCLQLGRLDEAQSCIEEALHIAPEDFEARVRLGNVLLERGQADRAAEEFRRAIAVNPASAGAHNSLGHALDVLGRTDEALALYERALELDPNDVQAHVNRSALLLLGGDYARGWDEYEWRLRNPHYAPVHERFGLPLWDGASLSGRAIVVYGEQGLGDQIMYASCVPDLLAMGARCMIDCDPRLEGLFRRSFPRVLVHGGGQTDPVGWLEAAGGADCRVPCASLARHLRRSADAFPSRPAYLLADPQRVARWQERLAQLGPGRKIGVSWRGGVPATGRGARSVPLRDWRAILEHAPAAFVSLQYGDCAAEIEALRRECGITIHHWPELSHDYEETAALVCALDLVVSVCTALVHLGGALGRPVWVIAPLRPEPRYGRTGPRMPWYRSVRVFRQAAYGEWRPLLEAVAAELRRAP